MAAHRRLEMSPHPPPPVAPVASRGLTRPIRALWWRALRWAIGVRLWPIGGQIRPNKARAFSGGAPPAPGPLPPRWGIFDIADLPEGKCPIHNRKAGNPRQRVIQNGRARGQTPPRPAALDDRVDHRWSRTRALAVPPPLAPPPRPGGLGRRSSVVGRPSSFVCRPPSAVRPRPPRLSHSICPTPRRRNSPRIWSNPPIRWAAEGIIPPKGVRMASTNDLPVRRLTLYKHGVGFVEREGAFEGGELQLVFKAGEVNDALKSLLVLDRRGGQVRGIDYETPADAAGRLAESPLHLSDDHSLLDLLRSLRGSTVRLVLGAGTQLQEVAGRLVGVELAEDAPARRALVALWDDARGGVVVQPLGDVREVVLRDDHNQQDLRYFLDASRSEESRRTVTVRLGPGEHDLAVSYLVPSPTWRVSYRLGAGAERGAGATGGAGAVPAPREGAVALPGWGLFDNRLDEDLQDVQVTLVAGQPISFVYDLATSRIPARRVVHDEARIAAGPVEFEQAIDQQRRGAPAAAAGPYVAEAAKQHLQVMAVPAFARPAPRVMAERISIADLAEQPAAAGGGGPG